MPAAAAPTHAISRVMGPLFFIVGLAVALRRIEPGVLMQAFFGDAAMVFLGGLMALVLGLIIVSVHNVWTSPTPILISLFGWLLCLRGVVLLFAPEAIRTIAERFTGTAIAPLVGGLVAAVLGAWFSYVGFFTNEPAAEA